MLSSPFKTFIIGLLVSCSSNEPKRAVPNTPLTDAAVNSETASNTGTSTNTGTALIDGGPVQLGMPCNGRVEYCAKRYDELCQAATHDSAAYNSEFWQAPAQSQSVRDQLNASVRALMLSVYDDGGTVSVCRGDCAAGSTALGVVLKTVKDFLDANPRDIVTLLIETALAASRVEREFVGLGLDRLAQPQVENAPWPTLQEMIDTGHRLVVFATVPDTSASWVLPRDAWLWETGKDFSSLSSMKCSPAVGDRTRPLYVVHHNLVEAADASNPEPSAELAAVANAFAVVTQRLQTCESQTNRVPNFVAVDFAALGDVVGGTQVINGLRTFP